MVGFGFRKFVLQNKIAQVFVFDISDRIQLKVELDCLKSTDTGANIHTMAPICVRMLGLNSMET